MWFGVWNELATMFFSLITEDSSQLLNVTQQHLGIIFFPDETFEKMHLNMKQTAIQLSERKEEQAIKQLFKEGTRSYEVQLMNCSESYSDLFTSLTRLTELHLNA